MSASLGSAPAEESAGRPGRPRWDGRRSSSRRAARRRASRSAGCAGSGTCGCSGSRWSAPLAVGDRPAGSPTGVSVVGQTRVVAGQTVVERRVVEHQVAGRVRDSLRCDRRCSSLQDRPDVAVELDVDDTLRHARSGPGRRHVVGHQRCLADEVRDLVLGLARPRSARSRAAAGCARGSRRNRSAPRPAAPGARSGPC